MKNLAGYIGLFAALGMAVCDMILLAQPVNGMEYDISSFGAMEHTGVISADIGSILGLVCAFFICFGFWHLKQLFEAVNAKLAMLLFILLCSVEFFGGAFHAGYYFLANRQLSELPVKLVGEGLAPLQVSDFRNHLEVISYLGIPGFLVGSSLFFYLALSENFPRWFRFVNPMITCGAFLILFSLLAAPVGGYLKPTFINAGLALTLGLSLMVSRKIE